MTERRDCDIAAEDGKRDARSGRREDTGTHGVVSDDVNAGDLLEALHDDSKKGTTEVLGRSPCEDLA